LAFQIAQARLARVAADYLGGRLEGELDFRVAKPVFSLLLWNQVPFDDLQLLFLGVPRQLQHFHAVAQGRRNRIEDIRRGQEQDPGKIKGYVQIVVLKGTVLFRIEHLEQRRSRIAAEVHPELVDLVENEQRVVRSRVAQPLDDAPR